MSFNFHSEVKIPLPIIKRRKKYFRVNNKKKLFYFCFLFIFHQKLKWSSWKTFLFHCEWEIIQTFRGYSIGSWDFLCIIFHLYFSIVFWKWFCVDNEKKEILYIFVLYYRFWSWFFDFLGSFFGFKCGMNYSLGFIDLVLKDFWQKTDKWIKPTHFLISFFTMGCCLD